MPLNLLSNGTSGTIARVSGGEEERKFLMNLGFLPGVEVKVVNSFSGNIIVDIKSSRIALNKEMARHILI